MNRNLVLSSDRPLEEPSVDRLGYAPFAKHLARSILRGCPADGLVVALYGPWGTGKSTALNFVVHYLKNDPDEEEPIIVRFNPWWFAGHEELTRRFFKQFEAAIFKSKGKKRNLLKKLSDYSALVSELPIPGADAAGKMAKAALSTMMEGADVVELKDELVAELARDASRIVVIMDDIDRLAASEIRQLFQVVKAVADFPNVIYLLAFDREVVVKALQQADGSQGDEYLEKIVQVPFALPVSDRIQLQALLFERLDRVLDGTSPELLDQQHWGNVYLDAIQSFIAKPRDIVRFTNSVSVTYPAVRGEVNAVDFLAIEALRLFSPIAYESIRSNMEMFVGLSMRVAHNQGERAEIQRFHESWLGSLSHREVVRRLILRLFPELGSVWGNTSYGDDWAPEWRRHLRVCSREVFPTYFRLAVPQGELSAEVVRQTLSELGDVNAFANRLLRLSKEKRPDGGHRASALLMRLRDYAEKEIPVEAVRSTIFALFEVGDEIVRNGEGPKGALEIDDEQRISWLIHALLRKLPLHERADVLKEPFARAGGLVMLVRELIGMGRQHRRHNGKGVPEEERLLAGEAIAPLEKTLRARIAAAGKDGTLWSSVSPLRLLHAWSDLGEVEKVKRCVATRVADDEALLAFIALFSAHVRSRGMGDRVGRTSLRIDPIRMDKFLDVAMVEERVNALRSRGLRERYKEVIDAFLRGRRARESGEDPQWMSDEEWDALRTNA